LGLAGENQRPLPKKEPPNSQITTIDTIEAHRLAGVEVDAGNDVAVVGAA
jgi:hypothetical protein